MRLLDSLIAFTQLLILLIAKNRFYAINELQSIGIENIHDLFAHEHLIPLLTGRFRQNSRIDQIVHDLPCSGKMNIADVRNVRLPHERIDEQRIEKLQCVKIVVH